MKFLDIYIQLLIIFTCLLKVSLNAQPYIVDGFPVQTEPVKIPESKTGNEADRNNYFNLINKYIYLDKYDAVQSLLDEYSVKYPASNDRRFYFYTGMLNEYRGRIFRAIENYQKAVEILPEYSKARNQLGYLLFVTGRYADSEDQLTRALTINPYNPFINFNIGNLYLKTGNFKMAREYLEKAGEYKKNYGEAFNALGIAYFHLKENLHAIDSLNRAVMYNYSSHETFFYLGKCFTEIGCKKKAFECFLKAVEIKKDYPECLLELGRISLSRKDYNSAIGYFLKAEAFDFDNVQIRYAVAECYYYLDRHDEAADIIGRCVNRKPGKEELPGLFEILRKEKNF